MKTIIFVVRSFPKPTQTFVVNQIIQAKKNGYAVRILTKKKLKLTNSTQKKLVEEYDLLKHTILESYAIPKNKFKRRLQALLLILKYFKYWRKIKKQERNNRKKYSTLPFQIDFYYNLKYVDVFHVQFAVSGVELAKMKEAGVLRSKIITTFHGYDAHFNNTNELRKLRFKYATLFRQSEYITVNTPFLQNQVEKLQVNSNKILVIPMGVDVHFFKRKAALNIDTARVVKLLSIGRLIEFKGFKYSIKAIDHLIKNGYKVTYTIVGEGELKAELQNLIDNLKLQEFITLVGKKDQIEIKKMMHSHHIFLMSSVFDSTGRTETQGVVTAEAQAAGLPVIAFNCGGVPYTLENKVSGTLVREKDILQYALSIMDICNDKEKYNKMSFSAVKYATEKFSIEVMGKHFMKLYKNNETTELC